MFYPVWIGKYRMKNNQFLKKSIKINGFRILQMHCGQKKVQLSITSSEIRGVCHQNLPFQRGIQMQFPDFGTGTRRKIRVGDTLYAAP